MYKPMDLNDAFTECICRMDLKECQVKSIYQDENGLWHAGFIISNEIKDEILNEREYDTNRK
jgi:hypothetical protein